MLRDEHSRAADAALNQHIDNAPATDPQKGPEAAPEVEAYPEPTRPDWSGGGMVAQQTAVMDTLKAAAHDRAQSAAELAPENAELSAASDDLDRHIQGQQQEAPEQYAAADALDRHIEGQEQGDLAQEFKDTGREVLDRHIESPEPPQGPANGPEAEIDHSPDIDM